MLLVELYPIVRINWAKAQQGGLLGKACQPSSEGSE